MSDDHALEQANELFLAKKFTDAIISYDAILKKSPNNLAALNNKGYALGKLKKHAEAISCYDAGLGICPNEKTLLVNKISSLRKIKSYDIALHYCDMILKSNPHDNIVLYHKERILLAMEDHVNAIQCCDNILTDYPQNAEVLFDKAVALSRIGNVAECILTLSHAIQYDQKIKIKAKNHSAFLQQQTNQEFLRLLS